ncbi:MAG: HAMP domain-containing histidine kinase [Anaerolineae bacterium]|nr:HAMP domain-containing histidine kinase [Anaerolineae bacterium]
MTTISKESRLNWRNIYLALISLIGLVLVIWGIIQIPTYDNLLTFFLLLILAVAAQTTATRLIESNVIVEVSSAVSMSVVALYGPSAAVLVVSASMVALTFFSIRENWPGWRGASERIGFNMGMSAIAIYVAGLVFHALAVPFGTSNILLAFVPWVVAAIVYDQLNLWILIVLLHLQMGAKPLDIWKEHRWVIPINVLVMSAGGGILALAVQQFGLLGIAIFFLPIVLSAYSFRLYVNRARQQLEQLEELVELRTADLAWANENLAEANKELEELSKEKDSFLAVLTHDMRTPLTSIKGYGSILRDRELDRVQQEHIAKVILRSQDTLLDIVNNLLEIGKLQSGTPILLERSSFDLALVVKSAAESLEASAMEKKIILNYDQIPSPVDITADEKKIHRVILNLISNAVKYTPDEGEVFINTSVNGKYAVVDIRDTGYGIPADELPYIFDRYSRVKKHQSIAIGTGLGLAIVKSLVEAHNGEISVTSEENVGSTFTVKLPTQVMSKSAEKAAEIAAA